MRYIQIEELSGFCNQGRMIEKKKDNHNKDKIKPV